MMQKELGEGLTLHQEPPRGMETRGGLLEGQRGVATVTGGAQKPQGLQCPFPPFTPCRCSRLDLWPGPGWPPRCHLGAPVASGSPRFREHLLRGCSLLGGPSGNPLPACGLVVAPGEAVLRWGAGQDMGGLLCRLLILLHSLPPSPHLSFSCPPRPFASSYLSFCHQFG